MRLPSPLFLTGASGFVGRRVLGRLVAAGYDDVRVLTRDPSRLASDSMLPAGWRVVRGDLLESGRWCSHLEGIETVVHLAASTGKARAGDHWEVIQKGTAALLERSRAVGVKRFLLVSSVAAAFANRRYYAYAEAKLAAEALVLASAVDSLIVRPTMVLGPGSQTLAGFRRLAGLPIPILFGPGTHEVQPIHVDDLADLLVAALGTLPWEGRTLTVGGPETVTIAELLGQLRTSVGDTTTRFRRFPLGLAREILGMLEPLFLPLLPFTAGQLATFDNPSRAEPDPFLARLGIPTRGIADMVGGRASNAS
jgi:nucleoside-diphosphate-sugar epimerase